jgi:glycosyltransferase involved in cell wall biosynthesis
VIAGMLRDKCKGLRYEHIVSHVEGGFLEKMVVMLKGLFRLLTYGKFDALHIHMASDISIFRKFLFVYAGFLLRKPVVVHVHGGDFDVFYHKCPAPIRYLIRITLARCGKVLVLSAHWRRFFQGLIPPELVEEMPNGIPTHEYTHCHNPDRPVHNFLFLGRLTRLKGVYDLLEAADRLVHGAGRTQLRFYLAGDGDEQQVRAIIQKRRLEDHVQLLGWLDQPAKLEWLSRTEAVVLPSYVEGLPICLLEAMAAGKPIISTATGGIPDLVSPENGWLVQPGDIEQLCASLQEASTNHNLTEQMAACNLQKAVSTYDIAAKNERLHVLYRQLTNQPIATPRAQPLLEPQS